MLTPTKDIIVVSDMVSDAYSITNTDPILPKMADTDISIWYRCIPNVFPQIVEENGIRLLLQNLDPHKAQGPDGIPARFLKETSIHIVPTLTLNIQEKEIRKKPL